MAKEREACGRCSTSIALEAATEGEGTEPDRSDRSPYGEDRIEVDEGQLQTYSPDGWMARVSSRLDAAVQRLTWGQ